MKNNSLAFSVFISILFLIIGQGCAEKVEGCLDPDGTNFAPDADITCCCEYPLLKLKFNHKADSLGFSLSNTYLDAVDSPFIFNYAAFYLSNFELVRADGSSIRVSDSLTVTYPSNVTQTVIDDFLFVSNNIFQADVGNIATIGDFTKLRFSVGIPTPPNLAIASEMPTNHALTVRTPSMYFNTDSGYVFTRFDIVADTASSNVETYTIWNENNIVPVELDYPITVKRGTDISLSLDINYLNFVENVNWQLDDQNTVLSKIVNNTNTVFSVSE